MATDDKGGNPTDLSGVTFIGRPKDGRESYHIQRASGKVLGPFDAELVLQMIRGGKLSGDEGVSTDRATWTPILTVPVFASAFQSAAKAPTHVGGDRPGPAATNVGMAADAWRSAADDDAPDADALADIPGLRRVAPVDETVPAGGGPSLPGSGTPTSELPMPEGFTNFPLGDDAPSFPQPAPNQATVETNAPPRLADAASAAAQPAPGGMTVELPQEAPPGWDQAPTARKHQTIEPTEMGDLPAAAGAADLPASAQPAEIEDLPTSAGGGLSELPASTHGRTNLPVSAAGLPTAAAGLPTAAAGLPTSAGELPGTADDLPVSATTQPVGAGLEELGGEATVPVVPNTELPASARGAGPSLLDAVAQTDDIWAAPGEGIHGRATAGRNPSGNFDTEAMQPGTLEPPPAPVDLDHTASDFGTAGGEFADFFPGDEDIAQPDFGTELIPEEAPAKKRDKKEKKRKKRKKGSSWGLRIGLMIVLLGVLSGAAFLITTIAKGPGRNEPTVVAPVETRPVVVIEVPALETLNNGAYRAYVDFVDRARTAVGDRGTPEDRASFLIGASMLFIEHPEHEELHTEMRRAFEAMQEAAGEDVSDPDLITLAGAAYLASVADDEAPAAIDAVTDGPHTAWGHFLSGVYDVQRFRGVGFEDEPEAEVDEAATQEGSGDLDGSGDAAADDEAADDEVAAEEDEDEEVAEILDEEELEAAQSEPAEEIFELSADSLRHFEAAIAVDATFVPAHYWHGWVALELGRAEDAQTYFEQALEQNPEHVGADIGVARSLMKQARLADADERIQRVIDISEAASSSMQRSDTFVAAAEIAIARMQPEIAIESLLSALQANPDNPEALRELGDQFFRVGQFTRAVEYFEGADSGSDDPNVTIGLAMARYGLEEYVGARNLLEAGATAHPRDGRFPYWLGRTYEEEAEFDLARQYYRQAMQTEPDNVRPLVRLAQLAQRENKPVDALRFLDEAMSTNADHASMANEIGEMYLGLGETNRAVSAFRTALQLDGSQPDARINLTEYYLDSGQQERAIEQLRIMLDSGVESPRVRFLNARALHGMDAHDRAIEEMLVLQEGDPDNPEYLFLMGEVHFDAGNFTAARQQFVRAWELDNTMVEAQYFIGRCDIELGGYNEAITSLTAASHRSASGRYHYWLGVALERAGQPAQALAEYDQAISGDIAWSLENPVVFGNRGRLFYSRGAMRAAYRDLRTVLTLRPRYADAAFTLGRVHYDEREYPKAVSVLEYALSVNAELSAAHFVAGLAYLRLEPAQLESALAHFETARDAGYGDTEPELFQKLAFVYRDLGRRGDAATALEAFLEASQLPYDEQREMENEIRRLRGQR